MRGCDPRVQGDEHDALDIQFTSHAESATAFRGTQSASVAYGCKPDHREMTTLRRDKFLP